MFWTGKCFKVLDAVKYHGRKKLVKMNTSTSKNAVVKSKQHNGVETGDRCRLVTTNNWVHVEKMWNGENVECKIM